MTGKPSCKTSIPDYSKDFLRWQESSHARHLLIPFCDWKTVMQDIYSRLLKGFSSVTGKKHYAKQLFLVTKGFPTKVSIQWQESYHTRHLFLTGNQYMTVIWNQSCNMSLTNYIEYFPESNQSTLLCHPDYWSDSPHWQKVVRKDSFYSSLKVFRTMMNSHMQN